MKIDAERNRVVTVTHTDQLGMLVEAQKDWPLQPKHIPGAVMIQLSSTLGNLHAVYVLGLRMTEGWVGFGTGIRKARFHRIGAIGPPMTSTLEANHIKRTRDRVFATYTFEYSQDDRLLYTATHSAIWTRSEL